MTTTTPTTNYAAIAAHSCSAELHLVVSLNNDLLDDHANGEADLTDDEYETALAVLAAAEIELHHRRALYTQALRENTARDRAARQVAFRQAVNHVADLIRKHKLDGEDIHTLTCAIDYDGATEAETYWGEDLTDTFAYLVNYCTVLDESAETLFAEAGLVLGW